MMDKRIAYLKSDLTQLYTDMLFFDGHKDGWEKLLDKEEQLIKQLSFISNDADQIIIDIKAALDYE